MSNFHGPAKQLMASLSYRSKFLFLSSIVLVTVLLLEIPSFYTGYERSVRAKVSQHGLDIIVEVSQLVEGIAKHRVTSLLALRGDPVMEERSKQLEFDIAEHFRSIRKQIKLTSQWVDLNPFLWSEFERQWKELELETYRKAGKVSWYSKGVGGEGYFDAHTELTETLRSRLRNVGYRTYTLATYNRNLALAVDLGGFELLAFVDKFEELLGILSLVADEGQFTTQSYLRLTNAKANVEISLDNFEFLRQELQELGMMELLTSDNGAIEALKKYLKLIRVQLIDADYFDSNIVNRLVVQANQISDQLIGTDTYLFEIAELEIANDIRMNRIMISVLLSLFVFLMFVISYLLMGFYQGVMESVTKLQTAAEELASGDLTVRISDTSADEMRAISEAFNKIAEAYESIVKKVKVSMEGVSSAVCQVSAVSVTTSVGMEEHHREIDVLVSAMSEMSATAQDVEKNTVEATHATHEADEYTREGDNVVGSAINTIQDLWEKVSSTTSVMNRLVEDAKAIGNVTEVIRGIADQTNLLALNAAIEAARAGDQGKGFAVVADEVRNLSRRTRESTDEIQTTIQALQVATIEAMKEMKSSREFAQRSVDSVVEAGSALKAIGISVDLVNRMNEQIASAATEQASTADELNSNMARLREIAEQASEGATSLVKEARHLEEASRITIEGINHFIVSK